TLNHACLPIPAPGRTSYNRKMTKFCSDVKPYPLGERKRIPVVNGIGLPTHIRFPGVRSRFTAASGILLSTKSPTDFSTGSAQIYIRNPAVTSRCTDEPLARLDAVREDGGA